MDHERTSLKPDHEDLASVEQLQDRSELSNIYPNPTALNDGELVSKEERDHRKEEQLLAISSDAPRSTIPIIFFFLSPLLVAAIFIYGFSLLLEPETVGLFLPAIVIAIGTTLLISWFFYKQFAAALYSHTIQIGPFVGILIGYLIPTAYLSTQLGIALGQPVGEPVQFAIALGILTVISLVLTWLLLVVWTKPKLSSRLRSIFLVAIFVIVSAAAALAPVILTR